MNMDAGTSQIQLLKSIETISGNNQSIIKEELFISNDSDDSDIEVLTCINGKNDKSELEISPSKIFKSISDEQSTNKDESNIEDEVIVLHLSSSSDDEEKSDKTIPNEENIFETAENNVVSISEYPLKRNSTKNKINFDDLTDFSELVYLKDELDIQSDEEYVMFDFSNYSADDILKAVESNKLPVCELKTNKNKMKTDNGTKATNTTINKTQMPRVLNTEICKPFLITMCKNCKLEQDVDVMKRYNSTIRALQSAICNQCEERIKFHCKICTSEFGTLFLAERHQQNFHPQNNQINLSSTNSLQSPLKNILDISESNEPWDFTCKRCNLKYKSRSSLYRHEKVCQSKLICKFCPASMSFKRQLREHLISNHEGEFKNEDLHNILNSIAHKVNQLPDILEDILGLCEKCKSTVKLREGQRRCPTCTSILTFQCGRSMCARVYNRFNDLVRHLHRIHLPSSTQQEEIEQEGGEKRLRCDSCSFVAWSNGQLERHVMQEHTGLKPELDYNYKCDNCGRMFKQLKWFQLHQMRFCRRLRQYFKCAHCAYLTYKKSRLRVHLQCNHVKVITGKLFRCPKCFHRFSSIYKLNSHFDGQCLALQSAQSPSVPEMRQNSCEPESKTSLKKKKSISHHRYIFATQQCIGSCCFNCPEQELIAMTKSPCHNCGKPYTYVCNICYTQYDKLFSIRKHISRKHGLMSNIYKSQNISLLRKPV